jgi:hypothetical protein
LNGAGASPKRVTWNEKTTLKKPRRPDGADFSERLHRPISFRRRQALTTPRWTMPENDSLLNCYG